MTLQRLPGVVLFAAVCGCDPREGADGRDDPVAPEAPRRPDSPVRPFLPGLPDQLQSQVSPFGAQCPQSHFFAVLAQAQWAAYFAGSDWNFLRQPSAQK